MMKRRNIMNKKLKKLASLFLVLSLVFALSACGGNNGGSQPSTPSTAIPSP